MTQQFLIAFGLFLVFEGLLYAFLPRQLRKLAENFKYMSDQELRVGGTVAIAIGVFVIWVVQSYS